nr:ABC transporter permease [Paenibacillus sp. NEAU-GSW1]
MGLLYSLMALGVYITFRILDFPDLTVDQSFTTGAGVAAVLITNGVSPWVASIAAFCAGGIAGMLTGLLHTKGKINGLLAGILMMIALYSINMRIMDKPNIGLLGTDNVFSSIKVLYLMPIVVIIIKVLLDLFFKTDIGLSLRATGDNERMIRSFGTNTDTTKIIGIALSNALVALSGSFVAQQGGFADITMGVGMIVIGLASVIIGEALFGGKTIFRATIAVILGSIVYRIIIGLAYQSNFLDVSDLKIITAVIVIIALVFPSMQKTWKQKKLARKRTAQLLNGVSDNKGGGR